MNNDHAIKAKKQKPGLTTTTRHSTMSECQENILTMAAAVKWLENSGNFFVIVKFPGN